MCKILHLSPQEVNSHSLSSIVATDRHVAALFYEQGDRATELILQLENIDDEVGCSLDSFPEIGFPAKLFA